jgi:hypothetical protein
MKSIILTIGITIQLSQLKYSWRWLLKTSLRYAVVEPNKKYNPIV